MSWTFDDGEMTFDDFFYTFDGFSIDDQTGENVMANTNTVPQALFGPGILWITRTDIANSTPVNIGYINEFSTDLSFDTKQLYGQNQYALIAARGTAKSTGKMKAATLSGQALNTVLLGGTWTAGTQYDATTIASTAIPATPFQITPTVPNSGTWNQDLGVTNAATSEPLTLVASGPTAGQYSVSAGVYTFSSADHVSGINVIISFAYTYTGATGQNQTIVSNPIGTTPTFQLDYKTTLYGSTYYLRLFNAIGSKTTFSHKLTDFMMPEYDFEFFANAAQNVGIISLATQA